MGSKGRTLVAELFRFNLVGVGTVAIGTGVFLLMVALGLDYRLALCGDYAAGILFSYYMNKHFTFRVAISNDMKPLALTVAGYATTFLLNLLLLSIAVEQLTLPVIPSQIAIMLLLAAINYLVFKYVIFGVLVRDGGRQTGKLMPDWDSRDA